MHVPVATRGNYHDRKVIYGSCSYRVFSAEAKMNAEVNMIGTRFDIEAR